MNAVLVAPSILLVEPNFVLRRTIVTVARQLAVGELHEAGSNAMALPLLASRSFDGLVLDTGDADATLHLLARLRVGEFASARDVPVLALVAVTEQDVVKASVAPYCVQATLCKPFKIAELLQLLGRMNAGVSRQPSG